MTPKNKGSSTKSYKIDSLLSCWTFQSQRFYVCRVVWPLRFKWLLKRQTPSEICKQINVIPFQEVNFQSKFFQCCLNFIELAGHFSNITNWKLPFPMLTLSFPKNLQLFVMGWRNFNGFKVDTEKKQYLNDNLDDFNFENFLSFTNMLHFFR